jgi:hypothetical protein
VKRCEFVLRRIATVVKFHTILPGLNANAKVTVLSPAQVVICGTCGDFNSMAVRGRRIGLLLVRSWGSGTYTTEGGVFMYDPAAEVAGCSSSNISAARAVLAENEPVLILCSEGVNVHDKGALGGASSNIFLVRPIVIPHPCCVLNSKLTPDSL